MPFDKQTIQGFQDVNDRVVETLFGIEERTRKETASPLDGEQMPKAQRLAEGRRKLGSFDVLSAEHDDMAQQAGLTPERPISREWVDAVIKMTKELRDGDR